MVMLNHLPGKIKKIIDFFGTIKLSLAAAPENAAPGTLIFFPYSRLRLACGLTGLIAFVPPQEQENLTGEVERILASSQVISGNRFSSTPPTNAEKSWGGSEFLGALANRIYALKSFSGFDLVYHHPELQQALTSFCSDLSSLIREEAAYMDANWAKFSSSDLEEINNRLILLCDIEWGIKAEFLKNIEKVGEISSHFSRHSQYSLWEFYRLVLVLNNLDQLEVRGRDSSGISTAFYLSGSNYEKFLGIIEKKELTKEFIDRKNIRNLLSHSISITKFKDRVSLMFTHKTAAVIGRLGDNVNRLKNQIRHDRIFFEASRLPKIHTSTIAHTRWASAGAITEENCHPVDNETRTGKFERIFPAYGRRGKIQVALNGDIDNYQGIKDFLQEKHNFVIDDKVTTDTKVIPLQIEHFLLEGHDLTESFRLAVNSFEGSHAITMHSDLMPEKIFLALRGSGQAIFVGLAHDSYIPASEIYGFVEQTPKYIKLEGETVINSLPPQGEIVILDKNSQGGLSGITSIRYDGSKRKLTEKDILHTNITTRDINRAGNPHFFLKEVSEAPKSIEKTIKGRVGIQKEKGKRHVFFNLGEEIIPGKLVGKIKNGKLKNIYFIGQGTAGVACNGIAGIFQDIFKGLRRGCHINIESKNSSEFSGFCLKADMSDSLTIAVSQSGSTTDTNRAIDLADQRKAFTMAIVNRRDSDITTKVDGVFYTSDGRDIEMSVASTKAFYSQITAGYLLALYFAKVLGMSEKEQLACVREISKLPAAIEQVLAEKEIIREAADRLALIKRYWAVVGSGPNKVAADEIRIKLSELCYKTISSDVVEDKKHIDLSAEPLIMVCAAGANESVLGDIVKDVAIFKAHGAVPVVIANKGEKRFHKIADAVLPAPEVGERLAPVINTVIGHIWGYYAACAIDNESKIFSAFHTETARAVGHFKSAGRSIYELISDRDYQAHLKNFLTYFTNRRAQGKLASTLEVKTASELTLLLKYMEGKLPLWECKEDFPLSREKEAVSLFLNCLEQAASELSRPIDAIKHQAKTVTVGTSRLIQDLSGRIFNEIKVHHRSTQYLSNFNIATLKRLQEVVEKVSGSSLYEITGLDYQGLVAAGAMIMTVSKIGTASSMKSRADKGSFLKGTKKMVMRTGEVFVGTGKSDKAQIIILPFLPDSGGKSYLLLLHIAFKTAVPSENLIYALGGKYDDIKDTFVESNLEWNDRLLTNIAVKDLFIYSDEAISDMLITRGDGNVS